MNKIRGNSKALRIGGQAGEKFLLRLFDIGAVKFGSFKYKLHDKHPEIPPAPNYIDLRLLRRFPAIKKLAVDLYEELAEPLSFSLLADVPTAATPLAASLSDRLKVGMITPRADNKKHGTGAKIDGILNSDKGKTALLIDDLITKADSKLEAIKVLKNGGVVVYDVVVLIDREQGGKEILKKEGYKLHSAFTMKEMFDLYLKTGKISREIYDDTHKRLKIFNSYLGIE